MSKSAAEDPVEIIEFEEGDSDSDEDRCSGVELDFDASKDLWVTVSVPNSRQQDGWDWKVLYIPL